jgi:putative iron-dependent peroxidase
MRKGIIRFKIYPSNVTDVINYYHEKIQDQQHEIMNNFQAGILEPIPQHAKYLFYDLLPGCDATECLNRLAETIDGVETVVGLGQSLTLSLQAKISGLRCLAAQSRAGLEIPSTPSALMCWLRGDDPGELLHRSRHITSMLADCFELSDCVDAFKHGSGRDLSGYEDGTENPKGQDAINAAFVNGAGPGLDGSSFVATQQWLHDFNAYAALGSDETDNCIGRRLSDNVEFEGSPESAHVKRTAQESFTPEAFMLRRSMPWSIPQAEGGLFFVAFGNSFDAFEAQLGRMIGDEDDIVDGLFQFTRPVGGAYFWCPPMINDRLDLQALGI